MLYNTFFLFSSTNADFSMYSTQVYKQIHDVKGFTYPHDSNCLVVLVPKAKKNSFLLTIIQSKTVGLIFCVWLIFVILRIIISKRPAHLWISELLLTLGIFLSQHSIQNPKSKLELFWLIMVLVFTIIALALLAGDFYRSLVLPHYAMDINTIDQLIASNLTILISPRYLAVLRTWTVNFR